MTTIQLSPHQSLALHEVSAEAHTRWKIKIKIKIRVVLAALDPQTRRAGQASPIAEIFDLAEVLHPSKINTLEKLLQDGTTNEDHWFSALID
jgi:hypothetical protein